MTPVRLERAASRSRVKHSTTVTLRSLFECCEPDKTGRNQTNCDVMNVVKLFPTVYGRIYCRKFLTLSNHTSRYKTQFSRIKAGSK